MNCPKCGKENINDSTNCFFCNTPLREINSDSQFVSVRVSKLALYAITIAVLGVILTIPSLINLRTPKALNRNLPIPHELASILFLLSLFCLGGAITLGLISFIKIEISGGRTTGRNFAVGAILIPIFTFVFLFSPFSLLRVRSVAFRMVCGTNLNGIAKAMLTYANDYDDELPRAGGLGSTWGASVIWNASTPNAAYSIKQNGTGGAATISASLYLLVKYADVTPKSFICKKADSGGDKGVSEYRPPKNTDLITLFDFGSEPWKHCSYAYHMPYGSYQLKTTSVPGMAVAADRNPWIPSVGWKPKKFLEFNPDGGKSITKNGNTPCHQDEGQNVLYLDTHVNFEDKSFCGVNEDNIYTSWDGTDIRKGKQPVFGSEPEDRLDSLLVNDQPIKNP
jgi:hypothetical protein